VARFFDHYLAQMAKNGGIWAEASYGQKLVTA
jgi:hypothetical protein